MKNTQIKKFSSGVQIVAVRGCKLYLNINFVECVGVLNV
jgi:hypothetical protein